MTKIFTITLICIFISISSLFAQIIVYPGNRSDQERLAAKEVRRFVYLRTGQLLPAKEVSSIPDSGDLILVANATNPFVKNVTNVNAPEGGFFIKYESNNDRNILVISGNNATSTLYGAYRFAEHLGVGFSLTRDVIPDKKITIDISGFDEVGEPLLKTRGILPFHDFPEGPDLWNTDDYMTVMSQLPKLGMNFIGLHTYPWAGTTQDKDMNILAGP